MRYPGKSFRFLRPAAWLPVLAWVVVLGFTAWIAAGWYWRLAAPRGEQAVSAVVTDVQAVAREINSRNLFGAPTSVQEAAVVSNSRYKLIGVAANSGSAPGFAIFQVDDKASLAAVEGQEIEPGVKLLRVLPRSVEIERHGQRETVPLNDGGSAVPPPPVAPGNSQAPAPAVPPPPDNIQTPRAAASMRPAPPPDADNAPQRESNSD